MKTNEEKIREACADRFLFRAQRENGEWIYFTLDDLVNDARLRAEWPRLKNQTACTNLKDKNGKLIFEGDIVDTGQWHGKSKVFYLNGSYKIKGHCGIVGFGSMAKKSEIIGNIYQNPELLTNSNL